MLADPELEHVARAATQAPTTSGDRPSASLPLTTSTSPPRNQAAEVERLLSLGAERVDWRYEPDADYVVLADPDGNRFYVVQKDG